jgi:hypothetical protein
MEKGKKNCLAFAFQANFLLLLFLLDDDNNKKKKKQNPSVVEGCSEEIAHFQGMDVNAHHQASFIFVRTCGCMGGGGGG